MPTVWTYIEKFLKLMDNRYEALLNELKSANIEAIEFGAFD